MRTFLLILAALVVASPTRAELISIMFPSGDFGTLDQSANGLTFRTFNTEVARMTISDFALSSTLQTRTARAENAADFGLNWSALIEWGLGLADDDNQTKIHSLRFFRGTNQSEDGAPLLPLGLNGDERLVGFVIDHIEFNVPFWLPNVARVQFNIVGEGNDRTRAYGVTAGCAHCHGFGACPITYTPSRQNFRLALCVVQPSNRTSQPLDELALSITTSGVRYSPSPI